MNSPRPPLSALLRCGLLLLVTNASAHAGSATWNLNPTSGDWNTAANWMPNTVPNGAADSATFAVSNTTAVSIPTSVEVDGIVFNTSAFAITPFLSNGLIVSGVGITNHSGLVQKFATRSDGSGILFTNNATAGISTTFTNSGSITSGTPGGSTAFAGNSTAGQGTFITNGGLVSGALGGITYFNDTATAGQGTFTINSGAVSGASGGQITFVLSSTAANGTFTINGSTVSNAFGGIVYFFETATAGNGTFTTMAAAIAGSGNGATVFFDSSTAGNSAFTNRGAAVSGATGGQLFFYGSSTADNGNIINDGGAVNGASGGETVFSDTSTAGNAVLTANGGVAAGNGGVIQFVADSTGDTARLAIFGNGAANDTTSGNLDISFHNAPGVTIGSIEGGGAVFLGAVNLTVGSNNLNTTFSGVIQDGGVFGGTGGSLSKTGMGKLTLSKANTYTGGTTVSKGTLLVTNRSGSATGTGKVKVQAGTLGGTGKISGAITVASGTKAAILAPGSGSKPGTLTTPSALTFKSHATYKIDLNSSTVTADKVVAKGVTINSGALVSIGDLGSGTLTTGTFFTVISNTSANPISGTFSNLADGQIVTVNGNNFQASYTGGDGNDLTLTVVP